MILIPKQIKEEEEDEKRFALSGSLSIIIHIIIFIVINSNNIIIKTKGAKFIPIEIITNESIAGSGESLKKQLKRNLKSKEYSSKNNNYEGERIIEEDQNSLFKQKKKESKQQKTIKENLRNSTNKESEKPNNLTDQGKMGSKKNIKENNIPEKGSVKGKGKVKITCLDCKSPKYPTKALRRGAEGSLLVKAWINSKGHVVKSIIIKSSGIESIDKSAIKAASESRFYPIESESTLNIEYDLRIR